MFTFIYNFFERRRQIKSSKIIIKGLLDTEVSKWLSYTSFSTGERKLPLILITILFDKKTFVYTATLKAPFSTSLFSFTFKAKIDPDYSAHPSVIDIEDVKNKISFIDYAGSREKGAFLYYGVEKACIKALRIYSSSKKSSTSNRNVSSSTNSSSNNDTSSNNPTNQPESQLLYQYISSELFTPDTNTYKNHPTIHCANETFTHSHSSCGSTGGYSDTSSSDSSPSSSD